MKIRLNYNDGRYYCLPALEDAVCETILEIEDQVWKAYLRHLEQDKVFQSLFTRMESFRFLAKERDELIEETIELEKGINSLKEQIEHQCKFKKELLQNTLELENEARG